MIVQGLQRRKPWIAQITMLVLCAGTTVSCGAFKETRNSPSLLLQRFESSEELPRAPESVRSKPVMVDSSLVASSENARRAGENSLVWYGGLERKPYGLVTFAAESPIGRPLKIAHYNICGQPPPPMTEINVMVLYTGTAAENDGNLPAVGPNGTVPTLIRLTNQSFLDSGVNLSLNLVHLEEVNINDTGDNVNVRIALKSNSTVRQLRKSHQADLVVLIVENGGNSSSFQYSGDPESAFSVVLRPNAGSHLKRVCVDPPLCTEEVDTEEGYHFPHEIGHLLGANHQPNDATINGQPGPSPGNSCGTQTYPCANDTGYNHGHVQPTPSNQAVKPWRTIMAHRSAICVVCGRILRWSNPAIQYPESGVGDPTGVAATSSHPSPREAENNACRINETAPSVSRFRAVPAPPTNLQVH